MKSVGVALAAIATICLPVSGQQFWNGTKAGMTKPQVKVLLGERVKDKPDDPDSLVINNHSFCDTSFQIDFGFGPNGLVAVLLVMTGKVKAVTENQWGRCVIGEYSAVYGKPVSVEDGPHETIEYIFTKSDTVVDISISKTSNFVSVLYRLRRKEL